MKMKKKVDEFMLLNATSSFIFFYCENRTQMNLIYYVSCFHILKNYKTT